MRVLVLQHTSSNPAGIYREVVEERGGVPTVVELDQGDPIPDWTAYDAIITMGGDMGVNDVDAFPWLKDEMRMIREAVGWGMPYWGVCLGGQLLAASLGARVSRLPQSEVGFPLIQLTEPADDDPVFSRLRRPLYAFVWHEDAFDLPAGAVPLGGTALANQAFRWREHAYGVQFHLEATAEMVGDWLEIPGSRASLERQLGPGGPERMLKELERRRGEQEAAARVLAGAWLDGFTGRRGWRLDQRSARPARTEGRGGRVGLESRYGDAEDEGHEGDDGDQDREEEHHPAQHHQLERASPANPRGQDGADVGLPSARGRSAR